LSLGCWKFLCNWGPLTSWSWLKPNQSVAEAVDGDVAIAAIGLGLVKREPGVKVTATSIVVNDYVFTSGECFVVEVLNGGAVIGWFVPRVNSWLAIDHSVSSPSRVSTVKNGM